MLDYDESFLNYFMQQDYLIVNCTIRLLAEQKTHIVYLERNPEIPQEL